MPVVPSAIFAPESMPWIRWAQERILALIDELNRKQLSDSNQNSNQNSTLNLLSKQLGDVEASIVALFGSVTIDAGQVVSGTFPPARIPTLDFSKISGGSASVTSINTSGSVSFAGSSTVGGNETVNGHIYVPNSTLASFGSWTIAYIDGDGRLARGASSARFKMDIVPEPLGKNYFDAQLSEFAMKGGNGWRVLGYIAEELVGTDMERFVVWERAEDEDGEFHALRDEDGNPIPLSIDWIPLLLAQNTQLKREIDAHTGRLERIEALLGLIEEN